MSSIPSSGTGGGLSERGRETRTQRSSRVFPDILLAILKQRCFNSCDNFSPNFVGTFWGVKKKSSSTSSTRKTKKVHHARINIFFFIIFKRGYSRFVPKLHAFKVGSTDLRFFLLRVGSLETHSVRCILSFYDGFVRSRVASCSLFTESARFSKFRACRTCKFFRDSRFRVPRDTFFSF